MHVISTENGGIIRFTYDEELSLAKSVMDCISIPWVKREFQTLLDKTYKTKTAYGSASDASDILEFLNFLKIYDIQDLGPVFEDNQQSIWHELANLNYSKDERNKLQNESVRLAWEEVWSKHHKIKSVAQAYATFPKIRIKELPIITESELQEKLDKEFWEEVDRLMKTFDYKCSRREAMIMAEETHPRGIMGE